VSTAVLLSLEHAPELALLLISKGLLTDTAIPRRSRRDWVTGIALLATGVR